jgi:hypothetical protein
VIQEPQNVLSVRKGDEINKKQRQKYMPMKDGRKKRRKTGCEKERRKVKWER